MSAKNQQLLRELLEFSQPQICSEFELFNSNSFSTNCQKILVDIYISNINKIKNGSLMKIPKMKSRENVCLTL